MSSISNDTFPCKSKMKGEIMSSRLIGCMHNVQIKKKKICLMWYGCSKLQQQQCDFFWLKHSRGGSNPRHTTEGAGTTGLDSSNPAAMCIMLANYFFQPLNYGLPKIVLFCPYGFLNEKSDFLEPECGFVSLLLFQFTSQNLSEKIDLLAMKHEYIFGYRYDTAV